ncbi:MAG: type IV pilin protein [Steroidobacteraceae bacterium]
MTRGAAARAGAAGFTLTELMVVVVIAALLLSIAVPSYQSYVRKSRRTEARSALLDLAGREERFFSTNNAYSATPADVGYSTFALVGSGYYNVTIAPIAAVPTTVPPTPPGYVITAQTTGIQVADTDCQKFTVDQTGTQGATSTAGAVTTATCWQ